MQMTDSYLIEHARLKDHVASMDGGLEAKIHEGGECTMFFSPVIGFAFCRLVVYCALSIGFSHATALCHRLFRNHVQVGPDS